MLGLTQSRFGPKRVRYYGLVQPLIDGLKLCRKEQIQIFNVTPLVFYGTIVLRFNIRFMEFLLLPYNFRFLTYTWSYLILLVIIGVTVYFILLAGFFSRRKYSYLGGIRSGVSSVSLEIMFSLNVIIFMLHNGAYHIKDNMNIGLFLLCLTTLISVLIETFRTPFDYAESERELVSGFNTEYRSVGFVLIFLKEYSSLIFFRILTSVLFFNGSFIVSVIVFYLVVLIRRSLPRVRYDSLIGIMWTQVFFNVSLYLYRLYCIVSL